MNASRLLIALAALLPAGCGPTAPPPPAPDAPARRVVSLAPSLTAWIEHLGAGDRLVGVTEYCRPETQPAPANIGRIDTPNLELIAEQNPDLIAATTMTPGRTLDRLRAQGWRVQVHDHESLDGLFQSLAMLGKATQQEAKAAEKIEVIRSALQTTVLGDEWPMWRTVVMLDLEPAYAAGPGSFPYEIVQAIGLPQITDGMAKPWPRLGNEAIIELNPQLVIVSAGEGRSTPEQLRTEWERLRTGPIWSQTDAGRDNNFLLVGNNGLTVPGPGLDNMLLRLKIKISMQAKAAATIERKRKREMEDYPPANP